MEYIPSIFIGHDWHFYQLNIVLYEAQATLISNQFVPNLY